MSRSPLKLFHSYENCIGYGLLPTPSIPPLRKAIWFHHPVIEIENALNQARKERDFTIVSESRPCEYVPGIYLKYLTGIYGTAIARISVDSGEAQKKNLIGEFSPRTKEIYSLLEGSLLEALQHASAGASSGGGAERLVSQGPNLAC